MCEVDQQPLKPLVVLRQGGSLGTGPGDTCSPWMACGSLDNQWPSLMLWLEFTWSSTRDGCDHTL